MHGTLVRMRQPSIKFYPCIEIAHVGLKTSEELKEKLIQSPMASLLSYIMLETVSKNRF